MAACILDVKHTEYFYGSTFELSSSLSVIVTVYVVYMAFVGPGILNKPVCQCQRNLDVMRKRKRPLTALKWAIYRFLLYCHTSHCGISSVMRCVFPRDFYSWSHNAASFCRKLYHLHLVNDAKPAVRSETMSSRVPAAFFN